MTIRSKIAQVAVAALVLGAGFSASAETAKAALKPLPAKLYLVTVDNKGCVDMNASDSPIAAFGRNCSAYMEAMPRDIWIPALRSKVISELCPKIDGARQCRTDLTEQQLRRTSDVQAVFLARQLGIKIPS